MKTIANCTPAEFLAQSWRIYKDVRDLLMDVDAASIRKKQPKLSGKETAEERDALIREQAKANLVEILQAMLEKHPQETARIMGLLCFIPEKELDKHSGIELLAPVVEILQNEEIVRFFSSLAK